MSSAVCVSVSVPAESSVPPSRKRSAPHHSKIRQSITLQELCELEASFEQEIVFPIVPLPKRPRVVKANRTQKKQTNVNQQAASLSNVLLPLAVNALHGSPDPECDVLKADETAKVALAPTEFELELKDRSAYDETAAMADDLPPLPPTYADDDLNPEPLYFDEFEVCPASPVHTSCNDKYFESWSDDPLNCFQ